MKSVKDQVYGQVRDQVYGQVRDQVLDQVYWQVYGQVSVKSGIMPIFQINTKT